jgi:large subunit ribosomal protein L21
MYAIIKTGGKQYRVAAGDIINVELLGVENDSQVQFKDVLFFHDGAQAKVGAPVIAGCVVNGEVLGESKGPKVVAFKYKRRKMYRRKVGHRQRYTRVKITGIVG